MKGRWIWSVFFLLPTGGAGYMTWMSWQANDDGKWLFGVFALFFLCLALAPFLPKAKPTEPTPPSTSTHFVPHWFMLLAGLALVVTVLVTIISAILRH